MLASRGNGDNAQSSVFELPRSRASREHPTAKPPALVALALRNSTRRGALVLDPFAGSGSTLVACEALGRSDRARPPLLRRDRRALGAAQRPKGEARATLVARPTKLTAAVAEAIVKAVRAGCPRGLAARTGPSLDDHEPPGYRLSQSRMNRLFLAIAVAMCSQEPSQRLPA